jgi:hypothetical protein
MASMALKKADKLRLEGNDLYKENKLLKGLWSSICVLYFSAGFVFGWCSTFLIPPRFPSRCMDVLESLVLSVAQTQEKIVADVYTPF